MAFERHFKTLVTLTHTLLLFRCTYPILFGILLWVMSCCFCPSVAARNEQKPNKKTQTEEPQPNMDGVVEVSFKIDASGKIQIVDLVSTSPQLSEYVIKKLAKIQISDQALASGKVIKYRFTFKKQA
jgi:hypothetical protein